VLLLRRKLLQLVCGSLHMLLLLLLLLLLCQIRHAFATNTCLGRSLRGIA
jgi:hypothetical protein